MSSIAMQGGATGSGTVTLLAPVTNTNRTINLPDSNGTVLTTATAGVPVNGPAFSAYNNATQSISSGTFVKILFQTEEFDTNSNFASSTFTPTVAGYYQVTGCASIAAAGATLFITSIYKNGAEYKRGNDFRGVTLSQAQQFNTALVYCNGSTDYIDIYGYNSGVTPVVGSGSAVTYFQAALVRSAT